MKKFVGQAGAGSESSVDIILLVLKAALSAQPESTLLSSFLRQYQERGSLSKKQLEGLHSKAKKVSGISQPHLATLEAIILKKPTRYKTDAATVHQPPPPDEDTPLIAAILSKYPQHKRVLFFKTKTDKNGVLSIVEKEELRKFRKLLLP